MESQVIANQQVAVNKFIDLAHTARHATGVGFGLNEEGFHELKVFYQ